MGGIVAMPSSERTRRFWRAHGRSLEHLAVFHAFWSNPGHPWTPEGLCVWYGLPVERARDILGEFAACGIVARLPGKDDRYVWNDAQDWVVPRAPTPRAIVQERGARSSGSRPPFTGTSPLPPIVAMQGRR